MLIFGDSLKIKKPASPNLAGSYAGDPAATRTPNPQLRRLVLYPFELQGRVMVCIIEAGRMGVNQDCY